MTIVSSQDFLTYYQKTANERSERLKELIPQDFTWDLDDLIEAPARSLPDWQTSLAEDQQEIMKRVWATLRPYYGPNPDTPFLPSDDPPREDKGAPSPAGGPVLPPGFLPKYTVTVGSTKLPLGNQLLKLGILEYKGPKVFRVNQAIIDTRKWEVSDGIVQFELMEGQDEWGPWILRCEFTLKKGDKPLGCTFNKMAWWLLKVTFPVPSNYIAPPFVW